MHGVQVIPTAHSTGGVLVVANIRRRLALSGVVGVMVVASALAVVPLGFTIWGGVLLGAWLRGAWDPTWNDGDGWYIAVAAVVLVVLLALTGVVAGVVARAGRLPIKRFVGATVGGVVLSASGAVGLFLVWQLARN